MVSLNIWRCPNRKCPNIQPGTEAQPCPECGCEFQPFGGFRDPFDFIRAKNQAINGRT